MSHFILEQRPDDDAVLLTLHADYEATRDLAESNPQVYAMLEAAEQPVYYVIDTSQTAFSLEDIIQAASVTSRGSMSTFHHPNVREVIVVTNNQTMQLGIKGLDSEVFGFVKVRVVETLDEAFAYIRAQAKH